jgi:hypothetical protein
LSFTTSSGIGHELTIPITKDEDECHYYENRRLALTTPIPGVPFPVGRGNKLREASPPLELTLGVYSRGAKPLSTTSPLLPGEAGVRS